MDKPIGIFDSGIGGLTVLKEINSRLPYEDLVYFGDTARVPYGTKSRETVIKFSSEIVKFLLSLDVKMIVVACNSASALALPSLLKRFNVPMLGVIKPGTQRAVEITKNRRIGVIGTRATIGSDAYEREIQKIAPDIKVFSRSCPVFVSLVEEGWSEHPATRHIAEEYLAPIREKDIDTLVLGCTHYPLLKRLLQEIMGDNTNIVDSALSCATAVKNILDEKDITIKRKTIAKVKYYVSDMSERFIELSSRFLGQSVEDVSLVRELE